MTTNETTSKDALIDVEFGQTRVRIEGSEDFVSDELPNVIQLVQENRELVSSPQESDEQEEQSPPGQDSSGAETPPLAEFREADEAEPVEEEPSRENDRMAKVAESLGVEREKLSSHFYIDDDEIHIQHPRDIDPKYALLGYAVLHKELTGENYLDNRETKEKLIDHEMVDIDRWGSNFIYRLRQEGLIKDDPNTDKQRNKPFKITPRGFNEFLDWLEENDE
jgi:hypothetical protein